MISDVGSVYLRWCLMWDDVWFTLVSDVGRMSSLHWCHMWEWCLVCIGAICGFSIFIYIGVRGGTCLIYVGVRCGSNV